NRLAYLRSSGERFQHDGALEMKAIPGLIFAILVAPLTWGQGITYPTNVTRITGTVSAANGGTGVASPGAHGIQMAEGISPFIFLASRATNGNCIVIFNVTGAVVVDPTCAISGVPVNAQTGTTYTLVYSDRGAYLRFSGQATATLTLCQITGTCA